MLVIAMHQRWGPGMVTGCRDSGFFRRHTGSHTRPGLAIITRWFPLLAHLPYKGIIHTNGG
jgi:hypothetical protein